MELLSRAFSLDGAIPDTPVPPVRLIVLMFEWERSREAEGCGRW